MARGQEYSDQQRKIIDRYYQHKDTISSQKLGEMVSELYLCTDPKKADRLWQRVELALKNSKANPAEVRKLLDDRNIERLAKLVATLG